MLEILLNTILESKTDRRQTDCGLSVAISKI